VGALTIRTPPARASATAVRVLGGAALIIAGIAAFIEASAHVPVYQCVQRPGCYETYLLPKSLSRANYDRLLIGAWALLLFRVLLVIVGLIGFVRRPATSGMGWKPPVPLIFVATMGLGICVGTRWNPAAYG
jgi:hypothetical protein